jgi:MerR family Zn(II)-responsive transcriptional regulator of zntA
MLISELSKRTGVSVHTIRFYEKSGLIQGRRKVEVKSNRYFHYNDEAVEKLELIKDAKSVGFTLQEINQLMDAWYSNRLSVAKKLAVLDAKILSIDEKIKQLRDMKKLVSEFKRNITEESC